MAKHVYIESFNDGPGGWQGWISNTQGPKRLDLNDGILTSRSPWWIDYNHAPPGAGYLHMVFCLSTSGPLSEHAREAGGDNRFIDGGFPIDFRDAKITIRAAGELIACGAELVLLIQGGVDGITSPWALTSQPFRVTQAWSEQSVTLVTDEVQWTCLGSRYDRTDMYGKKPFEKVIQNVSSNILLILFPLDVVPMGPIAGDPHILRPEQDYPVRRHRLPEGYVTLDEVRIEFPA